MEGEWGERCAAQVIACTDEGGEGDACLDSNVVA